MVLALSGSCGAVDIGVFYLDATNGSERMAAVRAVSAHLRPATERLTPLFGDFNFVEADEDRVSTETGEFTGKYNASESRHIQDALLCKWSLFEWAQPEYTCEVAGARSRVDRIYTNMALSEQQDRSIECVALARPYGLSTHRPPAFCSD